MKDPEELVAEGFHVPAAKYRVSGQCVVLQDNDPDDPDAVGWKAVVVGDTDGEQAVWEPVFTSDEVLQRWDNSIGCGC